MSSRNLRRFAALTGVAGITLMTAAAPTFAATTAADDVDVVNTETVQIYMNADGDVDSKRVYEQLALTGKGKVELSNPISTTGLRNLDGFAGVEAQDGTQKIETEVDGEKKLRSVSDFTGDLPLDVKMGYELDGKKVKPGDLVGKDGHVKVTFVVENVTSQAQEVSFPDGSGGTITKTVQVPVPVVGSLTTGAPSNFTNVTSEQANLAGDGKGGTKLSFTMTLFPPVGSTTATFSYEADVTDAVVPRIDISALPVNPLDVPTFKGAADSYQSGADTGARLTDGAIQIDSNLLRLRDGAAELLAGLIQLRDGAGELSTGLNDTAAPGARKLADGAEELSLGLLKLDDGAGQLSDGAGRLADGTGQLSSGAGELSAGAGRLSDGTGTALAGGKRLEAGLKQISGGLGQLAGKLPGATDGIAELQSGVDRIRAGISNPNCNPANPTDPNNPCGVLQGLQQLDNGLTRTDPNNPGLIMGSQQIAGGLQALLSTDPNAPGLPVAKGGVDTIRGEIQNALSASGSVQELVTALGGVRDGFCPQIADPVQRATCTGTLNAIIQNVNSTGDGDGIESLREKLSAADGGLGQVSGGLTTAIDGVGQLKGGADRLTAGLQTAEQGVTQLIAGIQSRLLPGLSNPACDLNDPKDPANPCGLRQGLDALAVGLTDAVAGVVALDEGASAAYSGSGDLTEGLGQLDSGAGDLAAGAQRLRAGAGDLDAGANKLRDGAGQLADGTGQASDGGSQLSDGADQLADGLGEAGDGSTKLFEGLVKAANGAPQLEDGAQRLSDEGTKKLIAAGESTTAEYGEMVAVIEAGAKRADAEKMAYGAPEGARGLTAYSFIIKGEDGESSRNVARTLGGLAVLGAGGGLFFLRRRGLI